MANLYEILGDHLQFIDMIEKLRESGSFDEETIKNTIEANQYDLEDKIISITGHIKNMQSDVEALKNESKRLAERAKQIENKVDYWTSYIDGALKAANIKEIKNGVHEIKYRKGSEVIEIDEGLVPRSIQLKNGEHLAIKKTKEVEEILSKPDLKKLLKEGKEIPGVSLVRKPDSLVIK